LLALLQDNAKADQVTGPQQSSTLEPVREFILLWLMNAANTSSHNESKVLQNITEENSDSEVDKLKCGGFMWLPSCTNFLVQVSLTYFCFFKVHLKILIQETERIDSRLCSLKESSQERVDLIHSHWTGLVGAEGNVREVCLNIIKSRIFPRPQEILDSQNKQIRELFHFISSVYDCVPNRASIWVDILKKAECIKKN